ncbi:DUF2855 family protein [Aliiglaciecola lipolytica]|uniref:DUF2855 domain-containing protein n=1 Tax=Aliiglaciecola lipolytica E3 TaxID=1127673 RepID=K6XQZ3_9ALTE|nr:DUF2855 family protein [Aliiglaciecola lipolytica]GAC14121.1 hypothetical protein GLIP_1486 [Aliiglaciecola lipolytica E3]
MSLFNRQQIQTSKTDLRQLKVSNDTIDTDLLASDQVVLKIESFGFSANNITYALFGEKMGYWGFFPAEEGFGIMPIWGFATVEYSNHPLISIGEKVFGYLPFATHLVISAGKVTPHDFYDINEQRHSISSVYDQYVRCNADPAYDSAKQDWQLNFRPLFMTSFVLDDFVREIATKSVNTIILTSASSKTAYGTAFLLRQHAQRSGLNYQVVGLTSNKNRSFTNQIGCYDQVVGYQDFASLDKSANSIVLDFSGNKPLLLELQSHFANNLEKMIYIGVTDVDSQAQSFAGELNGEFFFAPTQVNKRIKEWGGKGFMQRYSEAWGTFSQHMKPYLQTTYLQGIDDIKQIYLQGVDGNFLTNQMYVLRFD